MKKFSLKWKLFLAVSYLEFFCWAMMIIAAISNLVTTKISGDEVIYFSLLALALIIICTNIFLNIFALHQFFPDTPVPRRYTIFMRITVFVKGILWVGLLVLLIFEIKGLSSTDKGTYRAEVLVASITGSLWLIGLYTIIHQFYIVPQLNKNDSLKMKQLIDNIGDA